MSAVVASPAAVRVVAESEFRLTAAALHIVQPNGAIALTKVRIAEGGTADMAKLSADNLSVQVIPTIITDRAPFVIVLNLYTTFVEDVTAHKSNYSK